MSHPVKETVETTQLILAEFDSPKSLMDAASKTANEGFTAFDVFSPFPIHGMDDAMQLKPTPLGWIVFFHGLLGGAFGFLLQSWVATHAYKLTISGKPFFSFQAFIPVTFELMVLFSAFGTVFGMFALNKLPQFYHPVFRSQNFSKVTEDGFFLGIDAVDKKFDETTTQEFITKIGGKNIEVIKD